MHGLVDSLVQKASWLAETGDPVAACLLFEEAILIQPKSGTLWEQLSQCQLEAKDYEGAIISAEEAVRLEPQWCEAALTLARAALNLGNLRLAIREYTTCLELLGGVDSSVEEELVVAKSLRRQQLSRRIGIPGLDITEDFGGKLGPGCVVWEAGECLGEYLARQGPGPMRGKRVLELGSGTGVAGICVAALGARVVVSDAAAVLPLLQANAARHQALALAAQGSLRAISLDWDRPQNFHPDGSRSAQDPALAGRRGAPADPPGNDLESPPETAPGAASKAAAESTRGKDLAAGPTGETSDEVALNAVAEPLPGNDLETALGTAPAAGLPAAAEGRRGNEHECLGGRFVGAGPGCRAASGESCLEGGMNGQGCACCPQGGVEEGLGGFDLVLGADLVYGMRGVGPFLRCLGEVLGSNPGCGFLLAHKHRHADVDQALFAGLLGLGLEMGLVAEDGGSAVKVYSS